MTGDAITCIQKGDLMTVRTHRAAPSRHPRQLIVFEDSDRNALVQWIEGGTREVVIIVASKVTDVVRSMVTHARMVRLPVTFSDPRVEKQLSA